MEIGTLTGTRAVDEDSPSEAFRGSYDLNQILVISIRQSTGVCKEHKCVPLSMKHVGRRRGKRRVTNALFKYSNTKFNTVVIIE
jgi:hypothetical protein